VVAGFGFEEKEDEVGFVNGLRNGEGEPEVPSSMLVVDLEWRR
jgi:hypothetical protein